MTFILSLFYLLLHFVFVLILLSYTWVHMVHYFIFTTNNVSGCNVISYLSVTILHVDFFYFYSMALALILNICLEDVYY